MVIRQPQRNRRAFTLIELLVVIAIIAILAAILFPVFAVAREQARQSATISNMHDMYVGAKLFDEDEGHFPSVLFPYAETALAPGSIPANRPALPADLPNVVTMPNATGNFTTTNGTARGYLYREQDKNYIDFTCPDNVKAKTSDVTAVYWPLNSGHGGTAANPTPVQWTTPASAGCALGGDRDMPAGGAYPGQNKLYYVMDSMDIGPMIDSNGNIVTFPNGQPKYELHYAPDWTYNFGVGCDPPSGTPYVAQLKYQNPPPDQTVITYVTQHVLTAHSSKVIVLLLNGTAKKVDAKVAGQQLPLNFVP